MKIIVIFYEIGLWIIAIVDQFSQNGWGRKRPLEVIWSNPLLRQDHLEQVAHNHVQMTQISPTSATSLKVPWKVLQSLYHVCGPSADWPFQSLVFIFKFSCIHFQILGFLFLVKLLCYFPVIRSRKTILNYSCSDLLSCDIQHPFPNWFEIDYEIQLFHLLLTSKPCPKISVHIWSQVHFISKFYEEELEFTLASGN